MSRDSIPYMVAASILSFAIGVILTVLVVAVGLRDNPDASAARVATLTAHSLWSDFREGDGEKWLGKQIRVIGVTKFVDYDKGAVILGTSPRTNFAAMCHVADESRLTLDYVESWSMVELIGTCQGTDKGTVMLKDCEILSLTIGTEPLVRPID